VAGGPLTALEEARALRCEAIQVFVKSNRRWEGPPLDPAAAAAFREGMPRAGVRCAIAHGTYLVNLAARDRRVARRSREAFADDARRAEALGILGLVFQPGAHVGAGEERAFREIAAALRDALAATRGSPVLFLLENAAGQGTTVGTRFADLARMMALAGDDPRLGACLDTCHAFAAGNDIRTDAGYDALLAEIDATVGLARLRAVHLNDSKGDLGSRRDRHANLGLGTLGRTPFRRLVNDARLAGVPMVLETPGGLAGYRRDLRILRALRRRPGR